MNFRFLAPAFLLATSLYAGETFTLDNELASRKGEEGDPDGAWTLTLTVPRGQWEFSLENELSVPSITDPGDEVYGEATLGVSWSALEVLSLGATVAQLYLDNASETILAVQLTPSYSLGELSLDDENEIAYALDADMWGYTNTFTAEYGLSQGEKLATVISFENEAAKALESGAEWDDSFELGPVFSFQAFSLGLFYAPTILPDVDHGIKVSLTHTL